MSRPPPSMATGPPPYFNQEGYDAFTSMRLREDDIVLTSYGKCGTSWAHQIVFCLLRMHEDGSFPVGDVKDIIGGGGQVYPDGIRLKKNVPDARADPSQPSAASLFFGGWAFEDLLAQARPRLFTTHMRAGNLPASLRESGRMIMVTRNPKDALVSLYHFIVKLVSRDSLAHLKPLLKDGIEGVFEEYQKIVSAAEAGVGSGDYYSWHETMCALLEQLGTRATIVYYERLHADFEAEVSRLADFLSVPMTAPKMKAIAAHVSLGAMSARKVLTVRKGVVGDFEAHLTPKHWKAVDHAFEHHLGTVAAMQPLRAYMRPRRARL